MMKINLDGIHTNLRFSSAHMVIGHPSCGRIHGHSYIVDIAGTRTRRARHTDLEAALGLVGGL